MSLSLHSTRGIKSPSPIQCPINPSHIGNINRVLAWAFCRPAETGGRAGGLQLSHIFSKFDLLPIDNYSENKKVAKNIWTTPNSSKATRNIVLVFFRHCITLTLIEFVSSTLHFFCFTMTITSFKNNLL